MADGSTILALAPQGAKGPRLEDGIGQDHHLVARCTASPVAAKAAPGRGYETMTSETGQTPPSTLKRPSEKLLQNFRVSQVGDDTVGLFLEEGFSLAICCRACPRLSEWTPLDLDAKFGHRPDLRIADLASRLSCTGDEGCGSHDVAVFPHLYDGPWTWAPKVPGG